MTDRNVKLTLSVQTQGTSKAAAEVDRIAQEFAGIAKTSGAVGSSLRLAVYELQKLGATDDEIRRLTKSFNDYRKAVSLAADETRELGAEQAKVKTNAPGAPDAPGGVSLSSRLSRIGSEARALPSQRISLPGGGDIGTDALANFVRLGGALAGVSEKTAETSRVAQALAPKLGQAGAGFVAMGLQAAPFIIVAGAVAAAFISLSAEAQKSADAITATVDAQRKGNQEVLEGLTSDEARQKIKDLNEARKLEQPILDKTTAAYADFEKGARAAVLSGQDAGLEFVKLAVGTEGAVAILKAVRPEEDALYQAREASIGALQQNSSETEYYNSLLASGALAANDAAAALERLSDATIGEGDAAAKALAAKQRADNADSESNQKRLDAIADESAQLQANIDVLTASGLTTEDVTSKIAGLEAQLSALGVESAYISDVALAASKARDAEKQAAENQKKALDEATRAAEQNAKAVESAKTAYRNSVQDIGIRLVQTLEDSTTKLNRDLSSLSTKFEQEQYDLSLKSYRAERDAYQDQIDDLANIRQKAAKDEQKALIEGDFKELYLSRLSRDEALQQETREDEIARQRRAQSQQDALQDLNRTNQRQRDLATLGYNQRYEDARIAQNRDLAQARLTQDRALAATAAGLNSDLAMRGQYWKAVKQQTQDAIKQITGQAGVSTQGANAVSPFGAFESSFTTAVKR